MSAHAPLAFRPAVSEDLETCADVLYAADDALGAQYGQAAAPRNPGPLLALFAHIQRHNPDRFWIAERNGRIVGFSAAAGYAEMAFLGFLFVLPEHQAAGVGRALLERAMHDSSYRGVAIASYQPISAALYARYGMLPVVPIYMFSGRLTSELPALPAGLELRPVPIADCADLDIEVSSIERGHDHEFWESLGRRRFGLYEGSVLMGYGYVQEVGRVGPVVVRERAHLLPMVGALMGRVPPADAWLINVPAAASETFVALLRRGMRLEGPPAIYCVSELRADHSRYLPASYALP